MSINVLESCHFGNLASISLYQPELDQHPIPDTLASYPVPEIELELESDLEPHVSIFTRFFLYSGVNIESCTSTP